MIFLIEYDRPRGHIVQFRSRVDHDVVLLEAMSEEALRRTHRRYFENPRQIIESTSGGDAPP